MAQRGEDDGVAILREIRVMLESCGPVDVENVDEMNAMRLRMRERREELTASRRFAPQPSDWRDAIGRRLDELTKRDVRLEAVNNRDASLLRRSAPRNDALTSDELWAKFEALSPDERRKDIRSAERVLRRLAKSKKAKAV